MVSIFEIHHLFYRKLLDARYSKSLRLFLGLVILITLLSPISNSMTVLAQTDQAGVSNYAWTQQSAADPMLFTYMGDRSMRMDTANHPHIAFGGDHLYYSYHNGTNWSFEVVDPSVGVGLFTSLALDNSNRPHISYYDTIHGALKYAYYNGADWIITTLDQYAVSGEDDPNSLVDALGTSNRFVADRPWRSFPTSLPGDSNDPTAISPISDLIGYGLYSSIDIDAAGNIHIVYYDSVNKRLKICDQI